MPVHFNLPNINLTSVARSAILYLKGDRRMKIFGMNKKACKNLWVVYVIVNKNKYFLGLTAQKLKREK